MKNSINELAEKLASVFKEDVERVKGEVWGVVEFVLSDMYCLARDCARDEVVRKFVAPALELIMLDKALNDSNESNREREPSSSLARCMQPRWRETARWGGGVSCWPSVGSLTEGPRFCA